MTHLPLLKNPIRLAAFAITFLPVVALARTPVDCSPYICADGTTHARCAEDGTVINYFAPVCLTHGGDAGAQSFSDVRVDHPNADAIAYVKAQGIVEGYADGTFRPDQTINRAEFVKILVHGNESLYFPANCREEKSFTDVSLSAWYSDDVCKASRNGYIMGYPDNTFRPAQNINFVEAAKILVIAFDLPLPFEEESNPWYQFPVEALQDENAIPMSITHFDQQITRGEMAEMIYRLKTENRKKPSQTYNDLAHIQTMSVSLYLVKDNPNDIFSYATVQVSVPQSSAVLKSSLQALFDLHTQNGCYDANCTLRSEFYMSSLVVNSATIVDGVAHVKIQGEVSLPGDLSGPRAIEQIERTIRQFSSVKSTDVTLNGAPLKCLGDLSGVCK